MLCTGPNTRNRRDRHKRRSHSGSGAFNGSNIDSHPGHSDSSAFYGCNVDSHRGHSDTGAFNGVNVDSNSRNSNPGSCSRGNGSPYCGADAHVDSRPHGC